MKNKFLYYLFIVCILSFFHPQNSFAQTSEFERILAKINGSPYDSIKFYYNKGLKLIKQPNRVQQNTKLDYFTARRFFITGYHAEAAEMYIKSIKKVEKLVPFEDRVLMYYEASGLYSKNEELNTAEDYIRKGLKDAIKLDSTYLIADGYNRLGVIYEKRDLLDTAMSCYQKSLKLNQLSKNLIGQSYSFDNIAGIYGAKKMPEKALNYLKKSLAIRKKLNDQFSISIALINISESYNLMNKADSAIKYAKEATAMAHQIKFKDLEQYGHQHLSNLYKKTGNYRTAISHLEDGLVIKDSIFNETKSKQIAELTTKYQTEKKEEEIKLLNQKTKIKDLEISRKNSYLIFGTLLLFLIAISFGLYFNSRKIKEKLNLKNEIIKQQDLATKAVLDAEERERRRIALDLHDGVGQMLSVSLLNMNSFLSHVNHKLNPDELISGEKTLALINEGYDEMRNISHQMMPNSLIKTGLNTAVREFIQKIDEQRIKISLSISGLDERLDSRTETVLYRVIQESVNNTIKHAKASKLSIQLYKDAEEITLSIEDNGIGFDSSLKKEGIGLESIRSRIAFIGGTINYDTAIGKGTSINIFIPIS